VSIGAIKSDQATPEAARARTRKRRGYERQERRVLDQAREALVAMAAELGEAPRDMPDSSTLVDAYQSAMELVAKNDWHEARDRLFDLSVQAAGWCARIDLAHERESEPITCRKCGGVIAYDGRGRVPQKCEGCK
jgi:hypothetical protein